MKFLIIVLHSFILGKITLVRNDYHKRKEKYKICSSLKQAKVLKTTRVGHSSLLYCHYILIKMHTACGPIYIHLTHFSSIKSALLSVWIGQFTKYHQLTSNNLLKCLLDTYLSYRMKGVHPMN